MSPVEHTGNSVFYPFATKIPCGYKNGSSNSPSVHCLKPGGEKTPPPSSEKSR